MSSSGDPAISTNQISDVASGRRALVIGGCGFVGRNLVRKLTEGGGEVTVLDRAEDTTGIVHSNLILGDATDPSIVQEAIQTSRSEIVYHLAANSDISAGVEDASLDFGDTLMTTIALCQVARKLPVSRIVFASSSAIFGQIDDPIAEEFEGYERPASWYGKAKLASEYTLQALVADVPSTDVLCVRFPNVVGPLATHGVVYDFVRRLRANPGRLDVLGDGLQTKPYVHVSDLIGGIEYFEAKMNGGLTRINIGPEDTVNVKAIAAEVSAALRLNPEITYQDSPIGWPGDIPRYAFDTTKMRKAGYSITASSREAVRRAAEQLSLEALPPW